MKLDDLYMGIVALAFLVVSIALAGRFIVEAYCEYIQVREGIRIIKEAEEEDDEDETTG